MKENYFSVKRYCVKEDAIVPIYGIELTIFDSKLDVQKKLKVKNTKELCTIMEYGSLEDGALCYQLEKDSNLDTFIKNNDTMLLGYVSKGNYCGFFNQRKDGNYGSVIEANSISGLMQQAEYCLPTKESAKTLRKER